MQMQACNYAVQTKTDCTMRNDRDNLIVEMTTDFALIDETGYWLILCMRAKSYPNPDPELLSKLNDILRIISKIISSSKNKNSDIS